MTGSERDGDDPASHGLASNRQATVDQDDDYSIESLGPWPRWRRSRPFWGGLLVLLAGTEILLSERAPVPVVIHVGMQGLAGYLVPTILLLCGLLILFSPAQRTFYSVLAVLLSLGSWVTSNLGGFFVGMALGVVGGSLAFAWTRLSDNVPARQLESAPRREQLPPRLDQPAALDLLLGDPEEDDEDSRPRRDKPPLRDEPPVLADVPDADEPPIRIDVPSPEEPPLRQDAEAGDQEPGDETPPGGGPGARRGRPAGPLGPACL
ncbi:MAG TPA: DUF6114 domain-containing protein [Streptosporangiaceae bacterium]|nr:DUF6114 domain-containing protein [Streptosporangiaceae bacterium]